MHSFFPADASLSCLLRQGRQRGALVIHRTKGVCLGVYARSFLAILLGARRFII